MLGNRQRALLKARALRLRALEMRSRGERLVKSGSYVAGHRELGEAVRLYRRLLGARVVRDALPGAHQSAAFAYVHSPEPEPPLSDVRSEAGDALLRLANVSAGLLDFPAAVAYATDAADLKSLDMEGLDAADDKLRWQGSRHGLAVCLTDLSIFSCAVDAPNSAVVHAGRAVDLLVDAVGDPDSWLPDQKPQLATAYHVLGQAQLAAGTLDAAAEAVRQALAIRERRNAGGGRPSLVTYELANSLLLRCRIAIARREQKDAVAALTRGVKLTRTLGDAAEPLSGEAVRLAHLLHERFPGCLAGSAVDTWLHGS